MKSVYIVVKKYGYHLQLFMTHNVCKYIFLFITIINLEKLNTGFFFNKNTATYDQIFN